MEDLLFSKESVTADAAYKRKQVREFLAIEKLDGIVITSRKHFAWITSGGDSQVLRNTELGFGAVVITPDSHYLVAHTMDADRLIEEQAADQGYELVPVRWYEGDIREKAVALAGKRVGSDTDFPGAENVDSALVDLHYPMTALEIARLRWLGKKTDALFTHFAQEVQPGETEREIADRFHYAHLEAGMEVDVLIVGSDERCFKYRHPLPTQKRLKKYLMLHTVARRWGLHCNLTRFVNFGKPTERVHKVYSAASNVAARLILSLEPAVKFSEILSWQKEWYAEEGFPGEWENHFQGGPTGYVVVDGERCLTDKALKVNQPYEWFITVTGTKVGELVLLTEAGPEIASYQDSSWPGRIFEQEHFGRIVQPNIMIC